MLGRPLAALIVIAAVGIAGCGRKVIDHKKAERSVSAMLVANGAKPSQIKSVDCPSGVEPKRGKLYTCVVTRPNGTKVKVTFVLTDDKGGVRLK